MFSLHFICYQPSAISHSTRMTVVEMEKRISKIFGFYKIMLDHQKNSETGCSEPSISEVSNNLVSVTSLKDCQIIK